MGQFSHGEKSKQAARTNKADTSSRKNSWKSKEQETSQGFINRKCKTEKGVPKDADKRRVQADCQAADAGHWFTISDGKRVYVGKNGQELTGRAAYTLFKKESGAGFESKNAKNKSFATKNRVSIICFSCWIWTLILLGITQTVQVAHCWEKGE